MDLVSAAKSLYALPLEEFTGARDEQAKAAASAGDKALGAEIRKLKKASVAAWLVNMLVHHRSGEVEQILELGQALREAQEGLDRATLNALGQQRQRLVAAVARQSRDLAAELGHEVGVAALPDVEKTLRAAMTDPAAAAAVLSGRLLRPLEASGWDPVDLAGAVGGPFDAAAPVPAGPARGRASAPEDGAEESERAARLLDEARAALGESEAEAREAEATVARAEHRAHRVSVRREGLEASVEDLEERLQALRRELEVITEEAEDAERSRKEAAREAEAARRTLDRARRRVEELT